MFYTKENRDYILRIDQDKFAESPREWTSSTHMVCFHRNYRLGDQNHGIKRKRYQTWKALENWLIKHKNAKVILPIYLLDHSGLTMNTVGFDCTWDSGEVGFIYMDKETIEKEYGVKRLNKSVRTQIENRLRSEVETYDIYLRGEVYDISVHKLVYNEETNRMDEEIVDSCGGIYMTESMETFKQTCLECIDQVEESVAIELLEDLK